MIDETRRFTTVKPDLTSSRPNLPEKTAGLLHDSNEAEGRLLPCWRRSTLNLPAAVNQHLSNPQLFRRLTSASAFPLIKGGDLAHRSRLDAGQADLMPPRALC